MGNLEISGIFPKAEPCTDCPESELAVYRRIKEALPAGWTAWHSLKIRTRGAEFSESDFVIANPDRGILVLEVKGGLVEKKDGAWLQNGKPMKSSPLSQAHRFVRILLGKFAEKGLFAPPIGVAVVFPDTDFDAQPTQGDLEGLIIGARDLPYLEEALPRILERALREHTGRLSSPGWVGFLHGLWCESWPLGMSLSQVVKGLEARRIQLDKEQFTALESILENDLVCVRGGAGTGKTLLARQLAIREAQAGRRVLLLTFTEALGRELAAHIDLPGIVVSPVGLYALGKLRESGFDEPERYEPEFWDGVTRLAAESGEIWDGCRFDTVIIDEGQDFGGGRVADRRTVRRAGFGTAPDLDLRGREAGLLGEPEDPARARDAGVQVCPEAALPVPAGHPGPGRRLCRGRMGERARKARGRGPRPCGRHAQDRRERRYRRPSPTPRSGARSGPPRRRASRKATSPSCPSGA